MIQPISIKLTSGHVIPGYASISGDNAMVPVPVELLVIDSGPHVGTVVGYIRYLPDQEPIGKTTYSWQVASRIPNTDEYEYGSAYCSFNAALHRAMSQAYGYSSYLIDWEAML